MSTGQEKITDEMISAYLDGEASPAQLRALEQAMSADPVLQARVDRMGAADENIRGAFEALLDAPTPDPLADTIRKAVAAAPAPASRAAPLRGLRSVWNRPVALGWAVAAQALVVSMGVLALRPEPAPVPAASQTYHALSSATAPRQGDVLVMFDPTLTEAGMRTALKAADATIVGGPNETDAYVLAVPAGGLQKSLSALRAAKGVVMAEPLNGGAAS
jgi:anti-sigma factor RsiW